MREINGLMVGTTGTQFEGRKHGDIDEMMLRSQIRFTCFRMGKLLASNNCISKTL